ncbi:unnamed protein product [Arctia plantaginis]|uniref:NET domain-containing protein n=1 Tax=Arctia plantaginis TaxID=874455 RepID=A0A8S1AVG8_ARCPL|nr:unnamed protein product [Arctia plantaginis]CAB3260452.1 unnamed protein product [Arctia plantaginis]
MSEREKPYTSVGADGRGDGGDPSPSQTPDSRPMTYQELRNLSFGINMLTGEGLGRVVDIIQTHQPSYRAVNDNEFEIDFEKLNTTTLRALEKFVRSLVPSVYEEDTQH